MNRKSWKLEQTQTASTGPTVKLTDLLTVFLQTEVALSLRYSNRPNQTTLHLNSHEEAIAPLATLLTHSPLLHTYQLTEIPHPDLHWVNAIGQLTKPESFIEPQNYYIPHPFQAQRTPNLAPLLDLLSRLNGQCCLEITIQRETQDSSPWRNAIAQILTQLEAVRKQSNDYSDPLLKQTLDTYRYYQQHYAHTPLLRFQFKALAEHHSEANLVLSELARSAIVNQSPPCQPLLIDRSHALFSSCLGASQHLALCDAIASEGWQRSFTQLAIKEAIQPPRRGLDIFDDGSLSFGSLTTPKPAPKPMPRLGTASGGSLVRTGESALAPLTNASNTPRMRDLQPLRDLATAEELNPFCSIVAPVPSAASLPECFTLTDLIAQQGHLITADQYIVGLTPQGRLVTSSWSDIPHRIVAGITGTGKTNFLKSVIYQFLHANPQRQLHVADFQAGMHYQLIADFQPSLNLVTELEAFAELLGTLWVEHENRRNLMRENRVTSLDRLNAKLPEPKQRILLIIDEAFFILNADRKTKAEIDKHLTALAAQSRVSGIHIIYCSQRPTSDVIPRQISDNMDERVIFPVQSGASVMLLDDEAAASLPRKPKGRAIYRGLNPNLQLVATPYVSDEIWEN
ncbi:FtsK/SpoIIIE domain-containing protein [Spirulina major CS-329]|uniref:FtsK/SpoIIIE domain-containing protein n=1 Tax=Spirulina TaxID=1154 RepID=UPI00232C11AA|nr:MULTISPECIES: FtsK/SpoIIIE domain-containing protein [Spirulina]MDB9494914.1 FtsK/SpoIIIE domain-containing protein [Spirulina subsalsa CS-330]MDB9504141.1 FtsK/SpoIIIE domain-containing protein [Spirulina major CS-329]